MARSASTQPLPRGDYEPIANDGRNSDAFRAALADSLQKMLLDHPEMRLAKVIFGGKFRSQANTATDVVVVGLHEDDFYRDLPLQLRMWVFKPLGTDKIDLPHYRASRIQGFPVSVAIADIVGFQWVRPEDEQGYLDSMVGEIDE